MTANEIEMIAAPLVTACRTIEVARLIASCTGGDLWAGCAQYPRSDWREEVESGDSMLGYWEWVFCRADEDGIPVENLRQEGSVDLVEEIVCTIKVVGNPSDPEDEAIPGEYAVKVSSEKPFVLEALSARQKSAIAEAALDAWHDDHGVECLDDFTIEVFLPTGEQIEDDGDNIEGFSGSCL